MGFAVGIQHAFEADHISAVSTQISRSKLSKKLSWSMIKESFTKSGLLGVLWGAGHTTMLFLVGFLVYFFSFTIKEQVFDGFEFVVGAMLVFLGATAIINKKIRFFHKHPHQHVDGTFHFDEHTHDNSDHNHRHASYFIGLLHGLAGSGSLVAVTAATLDRVEFFLSFIVIFGIGSLIGMTLIGGIIGIPLALANKTRILQKCFRYVAGIFSLIIGLNIMYQIGVIGKMFDFSTVL